MCALSPNGDDIIFVATKT